MSFSGELAPYEGVSRASFARVLNQTSNKTNSGSGAVLNLGPHYWELRASIECATRELFDEWSAFFARRNGEENSFLWPRFLRRWPRNAAIVSDASLVLSSVNSAASTLTYSGWGAGLTAEVGDTLSYISAGGGYWFGEVVEKATADGSGNLTCKVWPVPVAKHATNPTPRRIEPLCEMIITRLTDPREAVDRLAWEFTAEQVIPT